MVADFSETLSRIYQTTRRHINSYRPHWVNFKSYTTRDPNSLQLYSCIQAVYKRP